MSSFKIIKLIGIVGNVWIVITSKSYHLLPDAEPGTEVYESVYPELHDTLLGAVHVDGAPRHPYGRVNFTVSLI